MNRRNALGLFGLLPFTSLLKAGDTPEELPDIEIGDRIQSLDLPQYIGRVFEFADNEWIERVKKEFRSNGKNFYWDNNFPKWDKYPIYLLNLDVSVVEKSKKIVNTIALTQLDCRIIEKGNNNEV